MAQPRVWVAIGCFVVYLGLALSVGNLYPISTFEMYAAGRGTSASRIIARDAAGGLHEVDELDGWACDGPTPLTPAACLPQWPYSYTGYLDRAAADFIDQHRGAGSEPVEVVRRIFRLTPAAGPPPVEDCLLQRCRATVRR